MTVVLNRGRDELDLASPRVVHLLDHLARLRLRVLERLSDVVDRREGEALTLEAIEPVCRWVFAECGDDQGDQRLAVDDARRVGREARIRHPLGVVEQFCELRELAVCHSSRWSERLSEKC